MLEVVEMWRLFNQNKVKGTTMGVDGGKDACGGVEEKITKK